MKTPIISKLDSHDILDAASKLATVGRLEISKNKLFYLDIDDAYIHNLFPLLNSYKVKLPDYFANGGSGAHISVIYPEEDRDINVNQLGQQHDFKVKDFVRAELGIKIYYVLLVESHSLLQLRREYKLSDLLSFKGYSIGFHITIGVGI